VTADYDWQKLIDAVSRPDKIGVGADAEGLNHKHKKLQVDKVYRLENSGLWAQYAQGRKSVTPLKTAKYPNRVTDDLIPSTSVDNPFQESRIKNNHALALMDLDKEFRLDKTRNEFFLFHGVKDDDTAQKILNKGIDPRTGNQFGCMFGMGTYFADFATKADCYAGPNPQGQSTGGAKCRMFLMRVTLGTPYVAHEGLMPRPNQRKPNTPLLTRPPTVGGVFDHHYDMNLTTGHVDHTAKMSDSIVFDRKKTNRNYNEYIIYDKTQAYPEFLIEYTRA